MRRASGSDGYVTLAVLLTAALLAAVVSSLVAVSRPALGLVRIGADEVAADALLQGGIASAAYLLFEARRGVSDVDGLSMRRATGAISVDVIDESGRIDINAAAPELLGGLYAATGGASMTPEAFASRVVDWRDQDNDVGEGGAEAAEYEDAGLPYRPTNRWFRSVEEARLILGLSSVEFVRLKPFITVYTGRAKIDPLTASETVLRAIPGIGRSGIQLILQARRQGLDREQIVALAGEASQFLSEVESSVYRVGVDVRLPGGFSDAVEAVIVAPQTRDGSVYRVAAWTRPAAAQRSR